MVTRQRRLRGEGKTTVALNAHIEPIAKAKIDRIADALGKSQGQILDLILRSVDVDANGRPGFYKGPLASEENEELPFATSA